MIISWDEYSTALAEIQRLKKRISELEKGDK